MTGRSASAAVRRPAGGRRTARGPRPAGRSIEEDAVVSLPVGEPPPAEPAPHCADCRAVCSSRLPEEDQIAALLAVMREFSKTVANSIAADRTQGMSASETIYSLVSELTMFAPKGHQLWSKGWVWGFWPLET